AGLAPRRRGEPAVPRLPARRPGRVNRPAAAKQERFAPDERPADHPLGPDAAPRRRDQPPGPGLLVRLPGGARRAFESARARGPGPFRPAFARLFHAPPAASPVRPRHVMKTFAERRATMKIFKENDHVI